MREGSSLRTYSCCTFFLFLLYTPLLPVGAASYPGSDVTRVMKSMSSCPLLQTIGRLVAL